MTVCGSTNVPCTFCTGDRATHQHGLVAQRTRPHHGPHRRHHRVRPLHGGQSERVANERVLAMGGSGPPSSSLSSPSQPSSPSQLTSPSLPLSSPLPSPLSPSSLSSLPAPLPQHRRTAARASAQLDDPPQCRTSCHTSPPHDLAHHRSSCTRFTSHCRTNRRPTVRAARAAAQLDEPPHCRTSCRTSPPHDLARHRSSCTRFTPHHRSNRLSAVRAAARAAALLDEPPHRRTSHRPAVRAATRAAALLDELPHRRTGLCTVPPHDLSHCTAA